MIKSIIARRTLWHVWFIPQYQFCLLMISHSANSVTKDSRNEISYDSVSISRILEPSPQVLISSIHYKHILYDDNLSWKLHIWMCIIALFLAGTTRQILKCIRLIHTIYTTQWFQKPPLQLSHEGPKRQLLRVFHSNFEEAT